MTAPDSRRQCIGNGSRPVAFVHLSTILDPTLSLDHKDREPVFPPKSWPPVTDRSERQAGSARCSGPSGPSVPAEATASVTAPRSASTAANAFSTSAGSGYISSEYP
jgi:hypothetical protein